jgi:hypothetical protein
MMGISGTIIATNISHGTIQIEIISIARIISPLVSNKSYRHKVCGNTKSEVENAMTTYYSLASVEIDFNVVMLKKMLSKG